MEMNEKTNKLQQQQQNQEPHINTKIPKWNKSLQKNITESICVGQLLLGIGPAWIVVGRHSDTPLEKPKGCLKNHMDAYYSRN